MSLNSPPNRKKPCETPSKIHKVCNGCGVEFDDDRKYKRNYCLECAKTRRNEQGRRSRKRIAYGLTEAKLDEVENNPVGVCPICLRETTLVVDHCHRFNLYRGRICRNCNLGLGNFKDCARPLIRAFLYLLAGRIKGHLFFLFKKIIYFLSERFHVRLDQVHSF